MAGYKPREVVTAASALAVDDARLVQWPRPLEGCFLGSAARGQGVATGSHPGLAGEQPSVCLTAFPPTRFPAGALLQHPVQPFPLLEEIVRRRTEGGPPSQGAPSRRAFHLTCGVQDTAPLPSQGCRRPAHMDPWVHAGFWKDRPGPGGQKGGGGHAGPP